MNVTKLMQLSFLLVALLLMNTLQAQNCNHAACGEVKCMGLIGLEEQHDSFIPPPSGFVPGVERDVIITVNYNGFTPQAQAAFQYAVDIWASLLTSGVPIVIDAYWEDIAGNTLGYAGATNFFQNFANAPQNGVYYPAALADKLAGFNQQAGLADIEATFDSGTNWYFGTDGNPGFGQFDFVSVVLHELGHGLGVIGATAVEGGVGVFYFGNPSVYDTYVENGSNQGITTFPNNSVTLANQLTSNNLFWNGPVAVGNNAGIDPKIYAPNPWEQGSSYSHIDENSYPAGSGNSLMTPFIAPGEAVHDPGPIIMGLMDDIGWTVAEVLPCEDLSYTFSITPDCYGTEITWQVEDAGGTVIASGGPYVDALPADIITYNTEVCLTPGCYTFTIFDSFGDGLNGAAEAGCGVDGSFTMIDNQGAEVFTMTTVNYGDQDTYAFCAEAGGGCSNLNLAFTDVPCADNGNGLLPVIELTPTFNGACTVEDVCLSTDQLNYDCFNLPTLPSPIELGSGDPLNIIDSDPNTTYYVYYTLSDGSQSSVFSYTTGDCLNQETICDCAGTEHTIGVLDWIGDGFADDGTYEWEGQPVDFNCSTWGFDCGDIGPTDDPYGVCLGDLPPNNGCDSGDVFGCTDPLATNYNPNATIDDGSCIYDQGCLPAGMTLSEDCLVDPETGDLITRILVEFSINGDCTVEDLCYSPVGGAETCFYLPDFNIFSGDGDAVFLTVPAAGSYEVYFSTLDGISSVSTIDVDCTDAIAGCTNPYAINFSPLAEINDPAACIYEDYICDCAGNQHTIGVLVWLGDGYLDDGTYEWEGQTVDFNCSTWGFDCGDGGQTDDPFGVCLGNLPPNNGCAGCAPADIAVFQDACADNGSGLLPVIGFDISINGSCLIQDFCFQENGGGFNCFDLPSLGILVGDGDPLFLTDTQPGAAYEFYFVLDDGTVSPTVTWVNGDCENEETICDCAGTQHTIGVLAWLGDGFADDGSYTWGGQPVDFNCATWGFDCGDFGINNDPNGVCLGNLPPNNGCVGEILGCTDPLALNYNPAATVNDGSCVYEIEGCTDALACNYDPDATAEDGSCNYDCYGCTDPEASNYDATATLDDGSCEYVDPEGCTDPEACNYDSNAVNDDGSCDYSCYGCTDPTANNYDSNATIDDGSCTYDIEGCMDAEACNYNLDATIDDGSCDYSCYGCTDVEACNYNMTATIDDGSCDYSCYGCTDEGACNFDANATIDDGSCEYDSCAGCTDPAAMNYDPNATIDDGSCEYECELPSGSLDAIGCNDGDSDIEFYVEVDLTELGNGAPYTMTNSQNGSFQTVNSTGTILYGPFDETEDVVITLSSTVYPNCVLTLPAIGCETAVYEEALVDLTIAPNPAAEYFAISGITTELTMVELCDMTGKVVRQIQLLPGVTRTELQVGDLAQGVYLMKFTASTAIRTECVIIRR